MIAEILTPWHEFLDGDGEAAREALVVSFLEEHFLGEPWSVTDATDQPAAQIDGGLVVVQVSCTNEQFSAISADPRFLVLWSEA